MFSASTTAVGAAAAGEADRVKEVMVDARIAKILSLRTESLSMLESLDAIGEFCTIDTPESRKALRANLEMQNVSHAKRFLAEMDTLLRDVQRVESLSLSLTTHCDALATRVHNADTNMRAFLDRAAALERTRHSLRTQSAEVALFLSKYSLSPAESALLREGDLDAPGVVPQFFHTLQRLSVALRDCVSLAQRECDGVGVELLDALAAQRDSAHAHLFAWVKRSCEAVAACEGSLSTHAHNAAGSAGATQLALTTSSEWEREEFAQRLQWAVRALRESPSYLSLTQDLLVAARRTQLLQAFLVAATQGDALTAALPPSVHAHVTQRGRPAGRAFNAALDFLSHDAVAYAAALLAWTHQALAQETEFFQGIFPRSEPPSPDASHVSDKDKEKEKREASRLDDNVADECVSRAVQGLARPLRARLAQCIEPTHAALETLYALTDLLGFYADTLNRVIRNENAVHSALRGCARECERHFLALLRRPLAAPPRSTTSAQELGTSSATRECATQCAALLRVSRNALSTRLVCARCVESTTATASEERKTEEDALCGSAVCGNALCGDAVCVELLAPLMQSCRTHAQTLSDAERAVYMLNNVSYLQHEICQALSLDDESFTAQGAPSQCDWRGLLVEEARVWLTALTQHELATALRRSDIDQLVDLIEVLPQGLVASEQLGLQRERVERVLRAFYGALCVTHAHTHSLSEKLQSPALRERVRREVAQRISESYAKVYAVVSDSLHGYDRSTLTHSVAQVDVLLGIAADDLA